MYPFDLIVDELDLKRDLSRSPIFDLLIEYQVEDYEDQSHATDPAARDNQNFTDNDLDNKTSIYDLNLVFVKTNNSLSLEFRYNTDLFEKNDIAKLFDHYSELVNIVSDSKKKKLADYNIQTDKDRNLIESFNKTDFEFDHSSNFLEYFSNQVDINPEKIALKFNNIEMTYREIDIKTNQMANFLLKVGALEQDDFVVLILDRSHDVVLSILATWKAGAAYIPIDPEYPSARIESILLDSKPKIVVFNNESKRSVFGNLGETTKHIVIDDFLEKSELESEIKTNVFINSSSLSYVIYTSGSTGKPKGAMVEHIGMLNHLLAKTNDLDINSDSIVSQNSSICFDISVWQFFVALMNGGKTIIYSNKDILNPIEFIEKVCSDKVNILELVPSYLNLLLDELSFQQKPDLKLSYLLVTGETLKKHLVERWFSNFDIPVVNAYGPTEASDDITHHIMTKSPELPTVPIGKTVQNFNIYIVDENLQQCPVGVKGEICVSGIGVGRGYLNNSEQTNKVFMTDPFNKEKDLRLYKTGDLGRYLPTGEILFYGRKDFQVKINGNRIETGEIESKLLELNGVNDAIVLVSENDRNEQFLVAYILIKNSLENTIIRNYLLSKLPSYMIPSFFIQMDKFPLSDNGKVNRKAFPEPEYNDSKSEKLLAKNKLENTILSIWEVVLNRKEISMSDQFFELGGNSLKAIQIVSKIFRECQVKAEIQDLFQYPVLLDFSEQIAKKEKTNFEEIPLVPLAEYYDLSGSQKQMWFLSQLDKDSTSYNMNFSYAFSKELKIDLLEKTFDLIINRHESLRTRFISVDGEIKQQILSSNENNFRLKQVNITSETKSVQSILDEASQKPFSLEKDSLFRATLVSKGEHYYLVMTIHHIISDGWSNTVLLEELLEIYQSLLENRETKLRTLNIQYKDYAHWLNKQSETDSEMRKFWHKHLSGTLPYTEIKPDNGITGQTESQCEFHSTELSTELTKKFKRLMKDNNQTLFITFTAVVNVFLYLYNNNKENLLGTVISGRNHIDLEKLIGLFFNSVPIKLTIKEETTFLNFLNSASEIIGEIYKYQAYPYDRLLKEIPHKYSVHITTEQIEENESTSTDSRSNISIVQEVDVKQEFKIDYDIAFVLLESSKTIEVQMIYNELLYNKSTIERITNSLIRLIDQIASSPERSISEYSLKDNDEKVNEYWNQYFNTELKKLTFPFISRLNSDEKLTKLEITSINLDLDAVNLLFSAVSTIGKEYTFKNEFSLGYLECKSKDFNYVPIKLTIDELSNLESTAALHIDHINNYKNTLNNESIFFEQSSLIINIDAQNTSDLEIEQIINERKDLYQSTLIFVLQRKDDSFVYSLYYNQKDNKDGAIINFAGQMARLIETIASDSNQLLASIEVLSSEEKYKLYMTSLSEIN